jgi:hypothetical protein
MKLIKYIKVIPFVWFFVSCSSTYSEVENNNSSNTKTEEV